MSQTFITSSVTRLALGLSLFAFTEAAAQQQSWRVSKASGEVILRSEGAQNVMATPDAVVNPGDTVTTGQNGRVLLVRGTESILISSDSSITIPQASTSKSTVVIQRTGSITLDVEKKNVEHFEVLTPNLAAVVKGTQFRVSVNPEGSRVDVINGQVQVSDFRSGQFALVSKSQTAHVFSRGESGLSLSGSGAFSPIQQGSPRSSPVPPAKPLVEASNTSKAVDRSSSEAPHAGPAAASEARDRAPSRSSMGGDAAFAPFEWLRSALTSNGKPVKDDPRLFAIPAAIGLGVAFGVSVIKRRRKKAKKS